MKRQVLVVNARDSKQLGVAIQRFRRAKKLTQAMLADLAGVLQKTVSAIERGGTGTEIKSIFKLLAALELEVVLKSRVL